MDFEERITQLETKLAFQEDMIEQLNKVIIEQGKTVDQLKVRIKTMNQAMKNMGDPRVAEKDDVPPPHY